MRIHRARAVAALLPYWAMLAMGLAFSLGFPNFGVATEQYGSSAFGEIGQFAPDRINREPVLVLASATVAEPTESLPADYYPTPPCASCQNYQPSGGYCGGYDLDAVCQDCPHHGLYIFQGYDAWRGHPDGGWGNWGVSAGANFGTRLGAFSDLTGIGFQIGGSAAAYNWAGTDYRLKNTDEAQPQGFITYGFFRKANERSPWSAAVVQDWMLNANYGVFAENPTLSQIRVQLGYATSAWSEYGIWGAWRCLDDSRNVQGFGNIQWRSIDQLNGYWHYKWYEDGVDTWLWVGVPERNRLNGEGSLGDYTVGALANAPLSDRVGLYSMVTYMHQSGRAGPLAAREDAWNFSVGITFYPGYNARTRTVAGQCWMPQLPVANNGYFLVDTNQVY